MIVLLSLMLMVTACNDDRVYSQFVHTGVEGWDKHEPITFGIDTVQQTGLYALSLGMRASREYPFKNLQVALEYTVFPRQQKQQEVINITVSDNDGNMLGHGISLYEYDLPIQKFNLNKGDSIAVTVRHNMKRETLPGIVDIGMTLRKNE